MNEGDRFDRLLKNLQRLNALAHTANLQRQALAESVAQALFTLINTPFH